MLQYLPNALTILRLLLVLPLCLLILEHNFSIALAVGFVAGLTDMLDGFFARKLQAFSRLGAVLDPIADKALIILTLLCLAQVELIPWYLAVAVIIRDIVIIIGAACYYRLIGPFKFAANLLSKCNMFIQLIFCALVLVGEVFNVIPSSLITYSGYAVVAIAAASGANYVITWSSKALATQRKADNG